MYLTLFPLLLCPPTLSFPQQPVVIIACCMSGNTLHHPPALCSDVWPFILFWNKCVTSPCMLCSEHVTMRRDLGNPLALSSKKPCQGQTDYRRELERLHADLEAEKGRTQRARGRLCVELRHLREEAEEEQQRAVKELTARQGCQKERYPHRQCCLPAKAKSIKESGRYREVRSTGKGSFSLYRGRTYAKLEQLLLLLYENISSEQPVFKLHRRKQLELKKALILCNLLEAHGRLLQGKQSAEHTGYVFKQDSRKQEDDNFCHPDPLLTRALLQRSHSASHSPQEKPKQDQQEQPLGKALQAADLCTTTAVRDTCQRGSLKICHPPTTTHAGWDEQPTCYVEFFRSEESAPSKCSYRNMEVSCFIFPKSTYFQKSEINVFE